MDTRKSKSILVNECGVFVYAEHGWMYLMNAAYTIRLKDTLAHRAQMIAEAKDIIAEIRMRCCTADIDDAPYEIKLCIEKYYEQLSCT